MRGLTSATLNLRNAFAFAITDVPEGKLPVLMEFKWHPGKQGGNHFRMDTSDYTFYLEEEEILLPDGILLLVDKIEEDVEIDS